MGLEEGVSFLLRSAGLRAASDQDVEVARAIVTEMDGLPLALDQVGAYIREKQCSLDRYRTLFQQAQYRSRLLEKRGRMAADHASVAATFQLAFEKVVENNAATVDLLRICAFLAPDQIPEEIFTSGNDALGEALNAAAQDELEWDDTIEDATRFSLIRRNGRTKRGSRTALPKILGDEPAIVRGEPS